MNEARGYIASGNFRGNRVPQHIQNKIIREYCRKNGLEYVMSKAEYAFQENTYSQLRAAVEENIPYIVMYSIWLLPTEKTLRVELLEKALTKGIRIHFACEELKLENGRQMYQIEELIAIEDNLIVSSKEIISEIRSCFKLIESDK